MSLVIAAELVPLTTDADGVIRIGATRVTLDTIVAAFREGMTAEGIVEQYPTLKLDDVYSVIGYFLRHQDAVDAYLQSRRALADQVRRENQARWDPAGVRSRLLARRQSQT